MQDAILKVNPKAALRVQCVGREQTPVILIDDFALDTEQLKDFACAASDYGPDDTSAYPGVRAKLPRGYVIAVLNNIYRLLFQVYKVPAELDLKPVNTVYSLITTPEDDLSMAQSVPHFDSNEPNYLAVLHYLNEGEFCPTGLFRHRPTGYEKVTRERLDRFLATSEDFNRIHGEPPSTYINGDTDHFELYDQIDYRPNRLVAYPGCLLHSGLVDPARDINADPRTGRLTANIFVDFK